MGTDTSSVAAVKVALDQGLCQGHNRCYALSPQIFDVDDFGQAILLDPGPLVGADADAARLAASNCPEFAITLSDSTTDGGTSDD